MDELGGWPSATMLSDVFSVEAGDVYPLARLDGVGSHVLFRTDFGAILRWLIDADATNGSRYFLFLRLNNDEAEQVVKDIDDPSIGMIESIRPNMQDNRGLLVLEEDGWVEAMWSTKLSRSGSEDAMLSQIFMPLEIGFFNRAGRKLVGRTRVRNRSRTSQWVSKLDALAGTAGDSQYA